MKAHEVFYLYWMIGMVLVVWGMPTQEDMHKYRIDKERIIMFIVMVGASLLWPLMLWDIKNDQ